MKKIKDIIWSPDYPPNEKCRYDHAFATLGHLTFQVEWKGWKDHDDMTVYITKPSYYEDFLGSAYDKNEAEQIITKYVIDQLKLWEQIYQ